MVAKLQYGDASVPSLQLLRIGAVGYERMLADRQLHAYYTDWLVTSEERHYTARNSSIEIPNWAQIDIKRLFPTS
jgi:hypothetical protein